jgi:sporulation protein YlmC with PRC-barrel domain
MLVDLSMPAVTIAQTATPAPKPESRGQSIEMSGFLGARDQSDLFASELIGHDVYARRVPVNKPVTDGQATIDTDGTHSMAMMNRAELDAMDNIGQINEIVLSSDGQIRAIVIGIGGFLGIDQQDVAVTMDQVMFASDPDDRSQMYVVVNTGAAMLKDSPRYERTVMTPDAAARANGAPTADRTAFAAPEVAREGYNRVEVTEVSTEMLVGKTVYAVNDEEVGTVADLIVDDAGAITNVIIDFGGFLGMGVSQVSVGFDELTILSNDGNADVRVYVAATKEQIQALPLYQAMY